MGWERELAAIENTLRNLNAQYDAFLYGSTNKPPLEIRRRLGAQIRRMSATESDSPADRFRFSSLQVRYNSLCERWDRLQSEKEAGRRPGIYGHFIRLGDSGDTGFRRQDPGIREPERPADRPNARAAASVERGTKTPRPRAGSRSATFLNAMSKPGGSGAKRSPACASTGSSRSWPSSARG